jgi:hypothetical protein
MTRTHMLQAVCTFAMLAATPALAQTQGPGSGMTGSSGQPNSAVQQPAPNSSAGMAPADNGSGSAASATGDSHFTHRSAMGHHTGMMHSRTDRSQDAAVDHLNDQSYQAAQSGQTFGSGSGSMGGSAAGSGSMGSSGMSGPGTLGSGDTSGGSMPVGSGTSPAK